MDKLSVLAIDLAKAKFQLHGNDASGKTVLQQTLSRGQMGRFAARLKPCTIAMEACGSAHYWARQLEAQGHKVRLIAPQHVKPFVRGNKNDAADAEAIAEAVVRPNMRFVPIKPQALADLQTIHRIRERLVRSRTALLNEIRAILFEHGLAIAKGPHSLKATLTGILRLEVPCELSPMARESLADLSLELAEMEERLAAVTARLERFAAQDETCQRLLSVPGVGPVTATAIYAAVPDPHAFRNGRQFAASLGLVPRHSGTGGKNRIGGISKRGDPYVRRLLIHGARSVLVRAAKKDDRLSRWASKLKEAKGTNKAAVALANKNARIIARLLTGGGRFDTAKLGRAKA